MVRTAGWLLLALALTAPLLAPGAAGAEGPGPALGLAGSYDTADRALGVAVAGDYAYVADNKNGLMVVDVSNPTDPTEVGGYDTAGYARGVAMAGDYAYVADYENGLVLVDVSNPADPTRAGGYGTGSAQGVAVAGNYAYVADGWGGLVVVDVSDPTDPSYVGGYGTAGNALDMAVAGDYAYVADGSGGLVVVDVSDPTDPTRVGGYDTAGSVYGVAVAGGYAYVADGDGGLVVVDVSDPADPTRIGGYDTAGYARGVAVAGDYAYVADDWSGLVVVDVSDPVDPTRVGGYNTAGYAYGMAVAGGYAYVANYFGGLVVVGPDSDGDGVVDVSDAFPNDLAASVDNDNDGWPGEWNAGKGEGDSTSGLRLDAIPGDPAASIDSDGDGWPDAWNAGKSQGDSTSGLRLDAFPNDPNEWADSDGDGVDDNGDAFPGDPAASVDSDGDGWPDAWNIGKSKGDSTTGLRLDTFPSNPDEWADSDGDGVGDNSDFAPAIRNDYIYGVAVLALILFTFAAFTLWSRRAIGSAERALRSLARDGVLLGPARERLVRARRARRRFNYPAAVARAYSARWQGARLERQHRELGVLMKRLRAEVAALRVEGAIVNGLEKELTILEDALGEGSGLEVMVTPITTEVAGSGVSPPFATGSIVYHENYGNGTIMACQNDGDKWVMDVLFPAGTKHILSTFLRELPAYLPVEPVIAMEDTSGVEILTGPAVPPERKEPGELSTPAPGDADVDGPETEDVDWLASSPRAGVPPSTDKPEVDPDTPEEEK